MHFEVNTPVWDDERNGSRKHQNSCVAFRLLVFLPSSWKERQYPSCQGRGQVWDQVRGRSGRLVLWSWGWTAGCRAGKGPGSGRWCSRNVGPSEGKNQHNLQWCTTTDAHCLFYIWIHVLTLWFSQEAVLQSTQTSFTRTTFKKRLFEAADWLMVGSMSARCG